MNAWLNRLWPERWRAKPALPPVERYKLLAAVAENEPCLRAVLDIAAEKLESEFQMVIDPQLPAEQRQRACDGLRVAYHFLLSLEDEIARAKAWRAEQERKTG